MNRKTTTLEQVQLEQTEAKPTVVSQVERLREIWESGADSQDCIYEVERLLREAASLEGQLQEAWPLSLQIVHRVNLKTVAELTDAKNALDLSDRRTQHRFNTALASAVHANAKLYAGERMHVFKGELEEMTSAVHSAIRHAISLRKDYTFPNSVYVGDYQRG